MPAVRGPFRGFGDVVDAVLTRGVLRCDQGELLPAFFAEEAHGRDQQILGAGAGGEDVGAFVRDRSPARSSSSPGRPSRTVGAIAWHIAESDEPSTIGEIVCA